MNAWVAKNVLAEVTALTVGEKKIKGQKEKIIAKLLPWK